MINLNCIIMGCHTWGFMKLKSMKKKDFDNIKAYCDKCADDQLVRLSTCTLEDDYNLFKKLHLIATLEQIKELRERDREKALYYKNNIDSDKTVIKLYTKTKEIDGDLYVHFNSILDRYIRVNNYPEEIFKTAEDVIKLCEKDNWKSAYWFDDNSGKVNAQDNISEAKERIKKMFEDNPDTVVEFG